MGAQDSSAFPAGPSRLFPLHEFSYTESPDVLEIVQHAHTVSGSVAFIQLFQPGTGKFPALEAESRAAIREDAACPYDAS